MKTEVYFFDNQWYHTDRLSQLHALPCTVTSREEAKEAVREKEGSDVVNSWD